MLIKMGEARIPVYCEVGDEDVPWCDLPYAVIGMILAIAHKIHNDNSSNEVSSACVSQHENTYRLAVRYTICDWDNFDYEPGSSPDRDLSDVYYITVHDDGKVSIEQWQ